MEFFKELWKKLGGLALITIVIFVLFYWIAIKLVPFLIDYKF